MKGYMATGEKLNHKLEEMVPNSAYHVVFLHPPPAALAFLSQYPQSFVYQTLV
jgi:hypothetical protein